MIILDRYVFGIVSSAIFGVLLVIIGIDSLAELITQMGDTKANYGFLQVLTYILLKIPGSITEYAGYSALIGVMIGLGMLSNSGELTVIRAAGFSLKRIGWMIMQPALALIICSAIVSEFVAPILDQQAENQRSLWLGKANFTEEEGGFWLFDKDSFVHVNAIFPDGRLFGLSRYTIDLEGAQLNASSSGLAVFDSNQQQWLETDYSWTDVNPRSVESGFESQTVWNTELNSQLLNMASLDADQMSIRDLSQYSQYLGEAEQRAREYRVQLWTKILSPLSIASLVFIGMSFVLGSNRQTSAGERIFVGVIVGTVFQLMQDIFGPASVVWGFSAFWAVLTPIFITLIAAIIMLRLKA